MRKPETKMRNRQPAVAAHAAAGTPPSRVQLSRRKGAKLPPNTVVVSRPSRWGNPFKATGEYPVERAVEDYEHWLFTDPNGMEILRAAQMELRGKNLACWCKPGKPCHADVLLRLVNT